MNAEVYYDDMGNDMRTRRDPRGYAREQAGEYRNILDWRLLPENDEEP